MENNAYTKILQNTTFNCKLTNEKGLNGYDWNKDLNMSIQGKNANLTMIEIINMIKLNKYNMDISITLIEGKEIYFKNKLNTFYNLTPLRRIIYNIVVGMQYFPYKYPFNVIIFF